MRNLEALFWYRIGRLLAVLAEKRPDRLYNVLVGLTFGIEERLGICPWLGNACEALSRRAIYEVPDTATLQLLSLQKAPSGTGRVS